MEDVAGASAHQRVVKGREKVDENERGREDGATDDEPGRPTRGGHDEEDGAGDGEPRTDAVGDGVGENVAQIRALVHGLMIVRHFADK